MFDWPPLSGSLKPRTQPQLVVCFAWASAPAVTLLLPQIIGTKPACGADMP